MSTMKFDAAADLALDSLSERTELSRHEIVGRALGWYKWALDETDAGSKLLIERQEWAYRIPVIGIPIRRRVVTELYLLLRASDKLEEKEGKDRPPGGKE